MSRDFRLKQERNDLNNMWKTIEDKEKQSDQIMMKVDIERDNLKTFHQLLDVEERGQNYEDPYYPYFPKMSRS